MNDPPTAIFYILSLSIRLLFINKGDSLPNRIPNVAPKNDKLYHFLHKFGDRL